MTPEDPPISNPFTETTPSQETKPDEFGDFVKNVSDLFAAGFVDPITDETRKSQRILMLIALALLLLASGAVGVGKTAKLGGFEFSGSRTTLICVGIIACGYLEAFVALRCFAEWRLYKLKAPREKNLWAIFHDLQEAKSKYLLPFSHSAGSYRIAKPGVDLARAEQNTEKARDTYVEKSRLISEKFSWFTSQFTAMGNIQKAKLVVDVWFPLIAGIAAIIYASFQVHLFQLIKAKF